MTDLPASPHEGPRELLSATRHLTRKVRQAQRGTWFPLLLFAAIILASVPVTTMNRHYAIGCRPNVADRVCVGFSTGSFIYWPIALVLAYAAIAAFYVRRARSRGVGARVRPYVIAGIIIGVAATGVSLLVVVHPAIWGYPAAPSTAAQLLYRLASPEAAIGLALLVLARVERNPPLLVFGLAYVVMIDVGWLVARPAPWPMPVLTATVLLLGSAGFALAERRAGPLAS